MSVTMEMRTPKKAELAQMLKAIADMIAVSGNETVSIDLRLTFDPRRKGTAKNERGA